MVPATDELQMLTIRPSTKAVLQPNWAAAGVDSIAVSEAKATAAKMIFFMFSSPLLGCVVPFSAGFPVTVATP